MKVQTLCRLSVAGAVATVGSMAGALLMGRQCATIEPLYNQCLQECSGRMNLVAQCTNGCWKESGAAQCYYGSGQQFWTYACVVVAAATTISTLCYICAAGHEGKKRRR